MSVKQPRKKKSKQKVLPVNCNRMMTAGACPLTFWTVIIYKLKGYKVRGVGPRLGRGPYQGPYSPSTGVVRVSELSPITLQPKKKKNVPQWKVLYTATPLLSPATLLSLDPLPCYSQCDICTLCYVDMCRCVCMCAYVCVYSSLPHVFLASGLALSPALPPMIGLLPPVMSRRAQCWNEKAAVLPCSWVSCLRVLTSLPFCGWSSLLVFVSLGRVHFGF